MPVKPLPGEDARIEVLTFKERGPLRIGQAIRRDSRVFYEELCKKATGRKQDERGTTEAGRDRG